MLATLQRILVTQERVNGKCQKMIDTLEALEPKILKLIADTKERNKMLEKHESDIQQIMHTLNLSRGGDAIISPYDHRR